MHSVLFFGLCRRRLAGRLARSLVGLVRDVLVDVPGGDPQERQQVCKHEASEEEEEEVEPPLVKILWEPPALPARPGGGRADERGEGAAEVAPQRDAEHLQRHPHGPHHVRRLVVEELELPHHAEHLARPDEEVLRDLPGGGEQRVSGSDGVDSGALDRGGGEHGADGDDHPPTDALQQRRLPAEAAEQRHERVLVRGDKRDDGDGVEQRHGRRRDAAAEEDPVHLLPLHDEEAVELRVDGRVGDSCEEDREHPQDELDLLDLLLGEAGTTVAGASVRSGGGGGGGGGGFVEPEEALAVVQLLALAVGRRGDEGLAERRLAVRGAPLAAVEVSRLQDLEDAHKRRTRGPNMAILWGADEEAADGDEERDRRDSVADGPADLLLDVDHRCRPDQRPAVDREVEPHEEGLLVLGVLRVVLVELVRPKRRDVWLDPAGAERDDVERRVEDAELRRGGGLPSWRVEPRDARLRRHGRHSQAVDRGEDEDRPVAPPPSVCEVRPEERGKVGRPREEHHLHS
mmetsp:Transcript_33294/g.78959  ORF Transcript_33294/g.78959 Transcript_33294/m.78959 type:complete len:516 (-) Transcript_33294:419-1966(-)